ncbi:prefoldin subunit 6-like [Lytechinus variegatus]|uniref:prefoldin subunit 6-like n=1 Tax=Lytechinus variegatus TaxID=7654 RepID=UPI001BB1B75A|nr:prefoldin subunit 6-like [Lytechinus variegatus]
MANEALQKKLQEELEKFKASEKEYQNAVGLRKQLDAQLNENSMVKDELDLLEAGSKVFKMMGPVLIQQDVEEANATVKKRMEYITGEVKRYDIQIKDLEKKQEAHREKLGKLQQEFSKAHMKAGGKT